MVQLSFFLPDALRASSLRASKFNLQNEDQALPSDIPVVSTCQDALSNAHVKCCFYALIQSPRKGASYTATLTTTARTLRRAEDSEVYGGHNILA